MAVRCGKLEFIKSYSFALLSVILILNTIQPQCTATIIENGDYDYADAEKSRKESTQQGVCYLIDVPYKGNVPEFDCTTYTVCVEVDVGVSLRYLMHCPTGHDGLPLFYDYKSCHCEERSKAVCFNFRDPINEEYFTCAETIKNNRSALEFLPTTTKWFANPNNDG